MHNKDAVTDFDKIVMFSNKEKQINSLFILPKSKHFISFLIALLRIFLKLISNKFGMVCQADENLQLDSRNSSMYLSILKLSNKQCLQRGENSLSSGHENCASPCQWLF